VNYVVIKLNLKITNTIRNENAKLDFCNVLSAKMKFNAGCTTIIKPIVKAINNSKNSNKMKLKNNLLNNKDPFKMATVIATWMNLTLT
jgi:hypothetical protein